MPLRQLWPASDAQKSGCTMLFVPEETQRSPSVSRNSPSPTLQFCKSSWPLWGRWIWKISLSLISLWPNQINLFVCKCLSFSAHQTPGPEFWELVQQQNESHSCFNLRSIYLGRLNKSVWFFLIIYCPRCKRIAPSHWHYALSCILSV